jgi:hypothetical protein
MVMTIAKRAFQVQALLAEITHALAVIVLDLNNNGCDEAHPCFSSLGGYVADGALSLQPHPQPANQSRYAQHRQR